MTNVVIDKNKRVRQSNEFVESPYSTEFSLHEIKIMEYLIAGCTLDDYKFIGKKQGKDYNFSATHIAKMLNTSLSRVVADGEKLAREIIKKSIMHKVLNPNGEINKFHYISIINEAKYEKGNFYFELNYKVLPFFLEVNENFTEYQLRHLLSMETPYAVKLYKILYQYKYKGVKVYTVDNLKLQFGIKDKYPSYKDFRVRILDKSINQINELTDINITFNEIKIGKKVESLEFIIKDKPKTIKLSPISESKDISIPEDLQTIISKIRNKISKQTLVLLSEYYFKEGAIFIEASIQYAIKNSKKNFDKYLQDTLNKKWANVLVKDLIEIKDKKSKYEELEKKSQLKTTEANKLAINEIMLKFNKLSIDERTNIMAELFEKISKICPERLPEIIKEQNEFIITYWALKNNLKYKGVFHLKLDTYMKNKI